MKIFPTISEGDISQDITYITPKNDSFVHSKKYWDIHQKIVGWSCFSVAKFSAVLRQNQLDMSCKNRNINFGKNKKTFQTLILHSSWPSTGQKSPNDKLPSANPITEQLTIYQWFSHIHANWNGISHSFPLISHVFTTHPVLAAAKAAARRSVAAVSGRSTFLPSAWGGDLHEEMIGSIIH